MAAFVVAGFILLTGFTLGYFYGRFDEANSLEQKEGLRVRKAEDELVRILRGETR